MTHLINRNGKLVKEVATPAEVHGQHMSIRDDILFYKYIIPHIGEWNSADDIPLQEWWEDHPQPRTSQLAVVVNETGHFLVRKAKVRKVEIEVTATVMVTLLNGNAFSDGGDPVPLPTDIPFDDALTWVRDRKLYYKMGFQYPEYALLSEKEAASGQWQDWRATIGGRWSGGVFTSGGPTKQMLGQE